MPDRDDVAKMAGVSGATVSRCFNNPESVSEKTKEKIYLAAETLNYHPNIIASNFVKGKSGNIGVIMPYIPGIHIFSVYYFSEILSGIGNALEQTGYDLVLFFNRNHNLCSTDYSRFFKSGKVDGCIILGTTTDDEGLAKLADSQFKFCLINNYIENKKVSFIDVDNEEGSYDAVKYLIGMGHKDIAILNGPTNYTNSTDRMSGYLKALKENGIKITKEWLFEGNYGKKSGFNTAKKILKLKRRPTAVFVSNDRMAAGLIMGLKEKGIRIPEDMSVTGYDDSDIATVIEPNLTTVHTPFYDLGYKCVIEFVNQLKGDTGVFGVKLKPRLIVRDSCNTLLS